MSGGIAYLLDAGRALRASGQPRVGRARGRSTPTTWRVDSRSARAHAALTGSDVARRLLDGWRQAGERFVKVMPEEYRRALRAQLELVS